MQFQEKSNIMEGNQLSLFMSNGC
ncbi:hypothetical protein AVEN_159648-1, partial [Araneus ventricosus]